MGQCSTLDGNMQIHTNFGGYLSPKKSKIKAAELYLANDNNLLNYITSEGGFFKLYRFNIFTYFVQKNLVKEQKQSKQETDTCAHTIGGLLVAKIPLFIPC